MESMGILGFIFGMSGLSFALMLKQQVEELKGEVNNLKEDLKASGVIK